MRLHTCMRMESGTELLPLRCRGPPRWHAPQPHSGTRRSHTAAHGHPFQLKAHARLTVMSRDAKRHDSSLNGLSGAKHRHPDGAVAHQHQAAPARGHTLDTAHDLHSLQFHLAVVVGDDPAVEGRQQAFSQCGRAAANSHAVPRRSDPQLGIPTRLQDIFEASKPPCTSQSSSVAWLPDSLSVIAHSRS